MKTKRAYKFNRNVSYSCQYHVVWCSKYRRKVLVEATAERLKQIISEVCQQHQAEVLRLEIRPDHVHILVEIDPQFGIHRLVRLITALAPGVSQPHDANAYPLDKELLCFDRRRRAFTHHEAVY